MSRVLTAAWLKLFEAQFLITITFCKAKVVNAYIYCKKQNGNE